MEIHPATLWEAIADAVPDQPVLVQGSTKRRSWRDFDERASLLAGLLAAHGLGPGAKVGQLLYNGPEFAESYFAALKLRAIPFNVNYRYTAAEVAYLLDDADADALVYHASLSGIVAEAAARSATTRLLVEVDDGGAHLDGSLRYEDSLPHSAKAPRITRDPNDVTMVYTGGTTGMPKGVVVKVGPALEYLLETVPPLVGRTPVTVDEVPALAVDLVGSGEAMTSLPAPPLIHNTALAIGMAPALAVGGTVVLMEGRHFDATELWDTVARERVSAITVVGDPFARPMLGALRNGPPRDLSCVRYISSSGAMFSTEVKTGLLDQLPQAMIIDIIGASEGMMGMAISSAGSPVATGQFQPLSGVIVVGEDGHVVEPGSGEAGLVALPGGAEGYYKDPAKTASTFRVIGGRRYTIPGDYANTGGEKVYPEEVEEVLKALPGVEDALVFGIDDERFGQSVASVIARTPGADESLAAILAAARQHLAGYKVPKTAIFVDEVPRTQVGKADYPVARRLLVEKHVQRQ